MNKFRRLSVTPAVMAAMVSLVIFLRTFSFDFVNLDDPYYVYNNPAIRTLDWQFVAEAFTTSYMGWWMPLTWISFAVDYRFWGLNPAGYHLSNTVLHSLNTGLVVLIAAKLLRDEGRGMRTQTADLKDEGAVEELNSSFNSHYSSFFILLLAGLLWGLHPLRVESVAWVTERKDVLSGFFSLACIVFYLRYVQASPSPDMRSRRDYLLSLGCLVLAMMAKPVSVVIPAMLLVADWYPLGRLSRGNIRAVLAEKVPFLFLGVAVAATTIYFAAGETILVSFVEFPLYRRLILAGYALAEYVGMTLFPVGLTHMYLLPQEFPPEYYGKAAITLLVSIWCLYNVKKRPYLLAVWVLFLLPLLPVLGIFQNGAQSHADRFTYIPAVAPSIAVAAAVGYWCRCTKSRLQQRLIPVCAVVVLIVCVIITCRLIGVWKNPETLWTRMIQIKPAGRAYYYRGEYYLKTGRHTAAADDLKVAISMAIGVGNLEVLKNLYSLRGFALYKAGQYNEAVHDYSMAIARSPEPNIFYHRAIALRAMGRLAEADEDYRRSGGVDAPIEWR